MLMVVNTISISFKLIGDNAWTFVMLKYNQPSREAKIIYYRIIIIDNNQRRRNVDVM